MPEGSVISVNLWVGPGGRNIRASGENVVNQTKHSVCYASAASYLRVIRGLFHFCHAPFFSGATLGQKICPAVSLSRVTISQNRKIFT